MGTRGTIEVIMDEGMGKKSVFLKQHWDGDTLPAVVSHALRRGESRWTDEGYLTRIIFSQMLMEYGKGDIKANVMELTGFAISGQFNESDVPVIVVDITKQQVGFRNEENKGRLRDVKSFADFAKAFPAYKKPGFFAGL